MERVTGVEPMSLAWKAIVIPLYYTRIIGDSERTRTPDRLLRRQLLYPTELRNQIRGVFLMRALYNSHLRLYFKVVYRLNRVIPLDYRIRRSSTERGARQEPLLNCLPYPLNFDTKLWFFILFLSNMVESTIMICF